jgi:hypothetical protein
MMKANNERSAFEPVLLDLSDSNDYSVLTSALEEYAAQMDHEADGERERILYNHLPEADSDESSMRERASSTRRLQESIETQIDANGDARQALGLG